ncbi:MAG: tail fiber domain-containing protein [Woeseiaceae bacterium]
MHTAKLRPLALSAFCIFLMASPVAAQYPGVSVFTDGTGSFDTTTWDQLGGVYRGGYYLFVDDANYMNGLFVAPSDLPDNYNNTTGLLQAADPIGGSNGPARLGINTGLPQDAGGGVLTNLGPGPLATLDVIGPSGSSTLGTTPLFALRATDANDTFRLRVLTVDRSGGDYRLLLFEGNAFKADGGTTWGVLSDGRVKKNVEEVDEVLDQLLQLKPVSFEFKEPGDGLQIPGRHRSFIAQDVEKVFPEWVVDGPDGYKALVPEGFEALTVAALRELRQEKDKQFAELRSEFTARVTKLRAEEEARLASKDRDISRLEARLERLERHLEQQIQ